MAVYSEKAKINIKIVRGESYTLALNNWKVDGSNLDLSTCVVKVDIKREVSSIREPDLTKTVENGQLVVSSNNLTIKFGEETKVLGACKYYYDVLVIRPNGMRHIYVTGVIDVSGTVTI